MENRRSDKAADPDYYSWDAELGTHQQPTLAYADSPTLELVYSDRSSSISFTLSVSQREKL